MKKFVALLLSFILVFTMIPPIIGPGTLADDNCPDNCEGRNPLPGYTLTDHFNYTIANRYVHCVVSQNAAGTRRSLVYFNGVLNESKQMTLSEIDAQKPYEITFNGTNGYASESMSSYFIDPPRADYINYTNQPFPLDENKHWLEKADQIEQGYYKIGQVSYPNLGHNRLLYFDIYRKMSVSNTLGKYERWDEGTTLATILCIASVIKTPVSILTLIGDFLTVGDIFEIATDELMVDYVTYTYDYIIIDPDYNIINYSQSTEYKYYKNSDGTHQFKDTYSDIRDVGRLTEDYALLFITKGQHEERYDTPCDTYCWVCATLSRPNPPHKYLNCTDSSCELCPHDRGPATGYLETDGHYYDNCYDDGCNRCPHARTEPVHNLTQPAWVAVGDYNKCRVNTRYCTRNGCTYAEILDTDDSHNYSNCQHAVCNDCSYNRGTVSGYLQDGHMYSNYCTATKCNRCLHIRTAPGHFYGGSPYWYHVKTASVCQEYRNDCTRTACNNYTVVQTDTSHTYSSWVYSSSSQHKRTCSTCSYVAYADHSYSSWTYYSASQHRRYCSACSCYFYQSHTWVYIPGSGNYCSICRHYQ